MSPRGRWLAASYACTLTAALLTGWALALAVSSYQGIGLVWLSAASLGLVWAGTVIARRGQDGGHGGH